MSNNVTELTGAALFNRFEQVLPDIDLKGCRLYLTEDQYGILSQITCQKECRYNSIHFCILTLQDANYFCVSDERNNIHGGVDINCSEENEYTEIDTVPVDIWTYCVNKMNLKVLPTVDNYQIMDIIPEDKLERQDIKYHQINEFFPKIFVYRIDKAIMVENNNYIHKSFLAFLISCDSLQYLNYNEIVNAKLKNLRNGFENEVSGYPFENLYRFITASQWRFSFLELYRCVERLYYVQEFCEVKGMLKNEFRLSALFNKMMDSRSREESKLTEIVTKSLSADLQPPDFITGKDDDGKKSRDVARYIYKIRNAIAHDQMVDGTIDFSESRWNDLIAYLISLINTVYPQYSTELNSLYGRTNEKYRLSVVPG